MAAATQTEGSDVESGDTVEIEFIGLAGRTRRRKTMEVEVTEIMGSTAYFEAPYDTDVSLVLGPDGDLWARDEDGKDGLYGTSTVVDGDLWESER